MNILNKQFMRMQMRINQAIVWVFVVALGMVLIYAGYCTAVGGDISADIGWLTAKVTCTR